MSKPYVGVKVNAKEVEIAAKSIHAYRRQIKRIDEDKEFLKNKKFHFFWHFKALPFPNF